MAVKRLLAISSQVVGLPALLVFFTSCASPVVSDSALSFAKQRVEAEVGTAPEEGSLVIVDYSKPSSEKRLTVVDLKSGRARMNSLVAHGVNSGLLYATDFSDRVGSNQSSLGLYRVGEPYVGKHGPSLRLDGLDPGFNINARKRAIVVHAADYVSKETMKENRHEYGRLGRSAGCLSLSDRDMKRLDRKLKRPAYIFAYAPTMVAEQHYPVPVRPGDPSTVLPQAMLAAAEKPAVRRGSPEVATGPVAVSQSDPAATPRPQLLGTAPASAGATQVPQAGGGVPASGAPAPSSHREREWTPLLTVSNAPR